MGDRTFMRGIFIVKHMATGWTYKENRKGSDVELQM